MLSVIIVDDEDHCVERLSRLLQKHSHTIDIKGCYSNVIDAVEAIECYSPDLVFLDVILTDGTGFNILNQVSKIDFDIIFTTAHNTYAVDAFEFSAIHYLLKPIDDDDLSVALDRYSKKSAFESKNKRLDTLIHNLEVNSATDKKLGIPTSKGLVFVSIGQIVRIEADKNYVTIFLAENTKYVVTRSLKYYDDLLDKRHFFRTHQSHLVNLAYVDKYIKAKNSYLIMQDGQEVPVSIRKKEAFLKQLADNQQY